jgi:REP element-mobilizing transposase RayT
MLPYLRKLPHFHPEDGVLFLTWRLWGSLPRQPPTRLYATPGQAFAAADRALHSRNTGPAWLKDPRIASIVVETILAGEQERHFYSLHAWVVMSNHVHLLIRPHIRVPAITRWLKGSTARKANKLLGRTGQPFWKDESYDRWVRDSREFDRILRYIEENPVSAGLVAGEELFPWSSASWTGGSACPTVTPTP